MTAYVSRIETGRREDTGIEDLVAVQPKKVALHYRHLAVLEEAGNLGA